MNNKYLKKSVGKISKPINPLKFNFKSIPIESRNQYYFSEEFKDKPQTFKDIIIIPSNNILIGQNSSKSIQPIVLNDLYQKKIEKDLEIINHKLNEISQTKGEPQLPDFEPILVNKSETKFSSDPILFDKSRITEIKAMSFLYNLAMRYKNSSGKLCF